MMEYFAKLEERFPKIQQPHQYIKLCRESSSRVFGLCEIVPGSHALLTHEIFLSVETVSTLLYARGTTTAQM